VSKFQFFFLWPSILNAFASPTPLRVIPLFRICEGLEGFILIKAMLQNMRFCLAT